MNLDEAKLLMKEQYKTVGEVEDNGNSLTVTIHKHKVLVSEPDLTTYATQYNDFAELFNRPNECSICSTKYREQVITSPPGIRIASTRLLRSLTTFGEKGNGLYAEISAASSLFQNRLRFESQYLESIVRTASDKYLWQFETEGDEIDDKDQRIVDIRRLFPSPVTIKLFDVNSTSLDQSIIDTTSMIEACIFELSYLKGLPAQMQDEWTRRQTAATKPFRFPEITLGNNLPFPKASYHAEILQFYQRGVGSQDPVIQFLSFYQVLEFFFLSVSDDQLYSKLTRRLIDPSFSYKPRFLDKLITDVLEHRRITDETEMLKLVLEEYVEFNELAEFIKAYEAYMTESIYTKRRELFGQEIPDAKIQEGHLHSNIAQRIKIIRNAVVHSSDRYERQERFVPLTKQSEEIISKEIPLLKFLAERVIVASASPIENNIHEMN